MRWRGSGSSTYVEDRRGHRPARVGTIPIKGGLGLIIVLLAAAYFGINPAKIVNQELRQSGSGSPGARTGVAPGVMP